MEIDENDYKSCGTPEEIEILSVLPEEERNLVFNLAGRETRRQNLFQWLTYLKDYVACYMKVHKISKKE